MDLLWEVSLSLRELLRLTRPHWCACGSQLRLLLQISQLLLVLLHQLELVRQLLQNILLLCREVLSLLETVQHLKLLLGEIEGRPLLWLLRHWLLASLESLRWYCIVIALDWIRWRCRWIGLLKNDEKIG